LTVWFSLSITDISTLHRGGTPPQESSKSIAIHRALEVTYGAATHSSKKAFLIQPTLVFSQVNGFYNRLLSGSLCAYYLSFPPIP